MTGRLSKSIPCFLRIVFYRASSPCLSRPPGFTEEEKGMPPPTAKRVRWDDSVSDRAKCVTTQTVGTSLPAESAGQSASALDVLSPAAQFCSANEAIRLESVRSSDDVLCESDSGRRGFRPEFTHQLFDGERIEGCSDGDMSIRVNFTAASLDFLVDVEASDGVAGRKAEVLARVLKGLEPGSYTTDKDRFKEQLDERQRAFKPPGTRLHDYKRAGKTFAVYRATGRDQGTCEYHRRAQCLAPWFIEAADAIDPTDDRWEFFYLFEEETSREVLGDKWRPAALAGYFTVFGFRNPVKGVSLRICQALVMPCFQRQGHGQALLAYVYGLARSRDCVFEVTIEDPAPAFEKVRNLVDARTLRDHRVFPADLLSSGTFQRPSKGDVQAAHEAVKLTTSQVEIGFDVLKARDICAFVASARVTCDQEETPSGGPDATDQSGDDRRKKYRLMVKRRLLRRYAEELSSDSAMRKRQLDDLYRDVEDGLLDLASKLRREEQGKARQGK